MVCSSVNARQTSVNPRHRLSAFRFAWRSERPVPVTIDEFPETVVGVVDSMFVKDMASVAVASSALYTSGPTVALALAKADCNNVCIELAVAVAANTSGEMLDLRTCFCFGDDDNVVTVVAAVRGRSPETLDMAAAEDEGNLPVNSSFLIRDLRSSNSSHTVEGAVVDNVDSVVPSCLAFSPSNRARSAASDMEACRTVREDWFDICEYLKRASARDVLKSICGSSGDVSWLYRLRGTPTTDLEPAVLEWWRRRELSSSG